VSAVGCFVYACRMDKHRTSLPAITFDPVTGQHRTIDVSETADSEPARGSFAVAAGAQLVEGVRGGGETGQGSGHRRP